MFYEVSLGLFGVLLHGGEELLGICGFARWEEMELTYELLPKLWGRGLATEAARACIRYAFEEVGLRRVIAGADAPNATSLRVIEKLGMKPAGSINPAPRTHPTTCCTGKISLESLSGTVHDCSLFDEAASLQQIPQLLHRHYGLLVPVNHSMTVGAEGNQSRGRMHLSFVVS
jgi:hypothetical protein